MINELKIISCINLVFNIGLAIILLNPIVASALCENGSNANKYLNSTDDSKTPPYESSNEKITQYIYVVLGVIIGSVATFLTMVKRMQIQARISYISTILKDKTTRTDLAKFIQILEIEEKTSGTLIDINDQINQPWFFLLFSPSKKIYKKLKKHIENKNWPKSLETISEFLSGKW